MSVKTLYPPAPDVVPVDIADPSSSYRMRVVLVLVSLLAFVALYFGMIAGSGWLFYHALMFGPDRSIPGQGFVLLKLGSVGAAAMLFLFLLKGLFKKRHVDRDQLVEITEEDEPKLFRFIEQVAEDTGAPPPLRVYLSPEVNAAVFYDSSVLNLVLPVRKNLLIGLGLVNVLTLDEFKAVLAHEFGHFSQKSMKLGSYVYLSNHIIADMVYGRDQWDDWLETWKGLDLRIGIFGWILFGLVWVLRKILGGVFQIINHANSSLSRQMEFQADRVAVSVTGSDSIVMALARLDFANDALDQAMQDLTTARDHQLVSRDLYFHQTRAAERLRVLRKNPLLGKPPALPDDPQETVAVFEPGDSGIPAMWATHPPNFDREANAKEIYIRSVRDERSPWLLFRDPAAVRAMVTAKVYEAMAANGKRCEPRPPEDVQAFIDAEHAETTYDPKYHGLYDDRFLDVGDLDSAVAEAEASPGSVKEVVAALRQLYPATLEDDLKTHFERRGEAALLHGLQSGELTLKGKAFEFRGKECAAGDVEKLLKRVSKEMDADFERYAAIDRQVFLVHYRLAKVLGGSDELLARYRFHLKLQSLAQQLAEAGNEVDAALQFLAQQQKRQIDPGDFQEALGIFRKARRILKTVLQEAAQMQLPQLRNLAGGEALDHLLLDEKLVRDPGKDCDSLPGDWIGDLLRQLNAVRERIKRFHFKSLGGILAQQEKLTATLAARIRAASARSASTSQ